MNQIKETKWVEVDAIALKVGQCFQILVKICDEEFRNPLLGNVFTVTAVTNPLVGSLLDNPLFEIKTGSRDFIFGEYDRVQVKAELRYLG